MTLLKSVPLGLPRTMNFQNSITLSTHSSHFLFQPEKYCSNKAFLRGNHLTVKPALLQSLINNQGNSLLLLLLVNIGG